MIKLTMTSLVFASERTPLWSAAGDQPTPNQPAPKHRHRTRPKRHPVSPRPALCTCHPFVPAGDVESPLYTFWCQSTLKAALEVTHFLARTSVQETGVLRALFHYEPAEAASEAVGNDHQTPDTTTHHKGSANCGGGSGGDGVGGGNMSGGGGNDSGGGAIGKSTPKPGRSRRSSEVDLAGMNGASSAGPSLSASTASAAL